MRIIITTNFLSAKTEKDLDVNSQHFVVQKSSCDERHHIKKNTIQKYQTLIMFNDSVSVVAQLQMLKTHLLGVA